MLCRYLIHQAGEAANDVRMALRQRSLKMGRDGLFAKGREVFVLLLEIFRAASKDQVWFSSSHMHGLADPGDSQLSQFFAKRLEILNCMRADEVPFERVLRDCL